MTPKAEQAYNQVIDAQIGSACRTIAQQAAAYVELQQKLDEADKLIAGLMRKEAERNEPIGAEKLHAVE